MKMLNKQNLELNDIQAIVLRGYGKQADAHYIYLEIEDATKAKKWLADHVSKVRDATESPSVEEDCMNLAFTKPGLVKLGLNAKNMGTFEDGIVNGMTTEHRARILGDHGNSAPEKWDWGHDYKVASNGGEMHILLMLFANGNDKIIDLHQSYSDGFAAGGLKEILMLDGIKLPGRKEHFGFRDGISQPIINGTSKATESNVVNTIKAGEMLLGYHNEYDKYPESPYLVKGNEQGDTSILPQHPINIENKDLGKNASYLVFRQLEQDVVKFWKFMDEKSKEHTYDTNEEPHTYLASKMVGRWPSGAPLVKCPFNDEPGYEDDDDFGYRGKSDDLNSEKCPLGSHLRRTNPRDGFEENEKKSTGLTKKHRIIRRGRPYGQPIADTMDPNDILSSTKIDEGRGLQFLAFNSDINRQFEFIQQTWINSQKFRGLYNDPDPIMGDPDEMQTGNIGDFTEQASPLRRKTEGIPRFVHVKGGAYFFLPGINCIKFLSTL